MNELLNEVLTAHRGAQRWQSVSAITTQGRSGGLLAKRLPGGKRRLQAMFLWGPAGRVLSRPTFLTLDFDEIEIERCGRPQPHAAPGERQAQ